MENNISILIVEDEDIWIESLHLILKDFGFTVVKTVSTSDDAITAFGSYEYDLVLMDIHLEGKKSGIELGKIVNKLYNKPFIFITGGNDHEIKEAFEARPSAYLPKPINHSSLFIAIQNAIHNFTNNKPASRTADEREFNSFFVKHGKTYKKIDWKDIAYLAAGKNYISAYNTIDKTEYYIRSSLQGILQHLIPEHLQKQFIQVNRSEAVQISFITEIEKDEVRTAFRNFALSDAFSKVLKSRLHIIS